MNVWNCIVFFLLVSFVNSKRWSKRGTDEIQDSHRSTSSSSFEDTINVDLIRQLDVCIEIPIFEAYKMDIVNYVKHGVDLPLEKIMVIPYIVSLWKEGKLNDRLPQIKKSFTIFWPLIEDQLERLRNKQKMNALLECLLKIATYRVRNYHIKKLWMAHAFR